MKDEESTDEVLGECAGLRRQLMQQYDELGDRQLVERIQGGELELFRVLVDRFQGRIYAHIYGMIRNREDARDLVQETFAKAYCNISGFRLEASFNTWLYRIASNVTIDYIRKHSRVKTSEFDERIGSDGVDDSLLDPDHLHRSPGRDQQRAELMRRIAQALQQLSPQQRQVVLLREIEGFSYKEIAQAMDIPEGDVMSRLFYARKRLQQILRDLR